MSIRCLVTAATLLIWLVAGCGSRDSGATQHVPEKGSATAEVERLLKAGASTDVVTRALGPPHSLQKSTKGLEIWHYDLKPFPAGGSMKGAYIDGLEIYFTNGAVAVHAFSYVVRQGGVVEAVEEPVLERQDAGLQTPRIRVFLVSSDPTEGGNLANYPRFPDLGYIRSVPDLEFTTVKDVTMRKDQTLPTVWELGIFLKSVDAERLKAFTSSNVGSRVLIVIGSEAVAAPMIMAPIEVGSIAVALKDEKLLEAVKRDLAAMKHLDRPPQRKP